MQRWALGTGEEESDISLALAVLLVSATTSFLPSRAAKAGPGIQIPALPLAWSPPESHACNSSGSFTREQLCHFTRCNFPALVAPLTPLPQSRRLSQPRPPQPHSEGSSPMRWQPLLLPWSSAALDVSARRGGTCLMGTQLNHHALLTDSPSWEPSGTKEEQTDTFPSLAPSASDHVVQHRRARI